MKKDEISGGIILFLFGGITTLLSLRMPIGTFRSAGTGLFPLCLGLLLITLSLFFLIITFSKTEAAKKIQETKITVPESTMRVALFLGVTALTVLFLNKTGFLISAFFLMALLIRILGFRRWIPNISLSIITAVASYFLFVQWLKIPLPKGFIGL